MAARDGGDGGVVDSGVDSREQTQTVRCATVSQMSNAPRTIALVSPPWRPPAEPCLALATLSPLIAAAGWSPVTHHTTLHYPDVSVDGLFMASYSAHLFGALLVPVSKRPPNTSQPRPAVVFMSATLSAVCVTEGVLTQGAQ